MSKIALCCILLFAWVFMPAVSWGEELYPGRWWHVPELSDKLHLSYDQKMRLDELYSENRSNLAKLKQSVESEQSELENLIEKEPISEAAISAKMKSLDLARDKLSAERMRYVVEMRKLLGYERFQQLKQYYRYSRERRDPGAGSFGIRFGPFNFGIMGR